MPANNPDLKGIQNMNRFLFFCICILELLQPPISLAMATEDDPTEPTAKHTPAPFIPPGTLNQDPSQGKLKGKVLRIKRPLLMVTDLKRSIEFYENIIGLELYSVDPHYVSDPSSIGSRVFNTAPDARRRIATMNTSDEVRGLSLREIPDIEFEIPQSPRIMTVLFETSDIVELHDRALKAGVTVITPGVGEVPATDISPRLRFMEFALLDPDGHVLAFFKRFEEGDEAAWKKANELNKAPKN